MSVSGTPVKQLMQVTFDANPVIHAPIMLGNECFVITQQDVRRIEDMRYIYYSKMGPNGQLIPLENEPLEKSKLEDSRLLDVLQLVQQYRQQTQQPVALFNSQSAAGPSLLQQQQQPVTLFNSQPTLLQQQCQLSPRTLQIYPTPMEIDQNPDPQNSMPLLASIQQQLNWNKNANASPAFPLHQTVGTNTNTISIETDCKKADVPRKSTLKPYCNRGVNVQLTEIQTLGARDEVKQRKILRFATDL